MLAYALKKEIQIALNILTYYLAISVLQRKCSHKILNQDLELWKERKKETQYNF